MVKQSFVLNSILLLLVLSFSCVAFAVRSGDWEYEVNDKNEAVITAYSGENINLVVPSAIDGYKVTKIGSEAFRGVSLFSIVIPSTITSISSDAFMGCYNLEVINVDEGNKNYVSEDGVLFNRDKTELIKCPQTKSGKYSIPSSVTKISDRAFSNCLQLGELVIPSSVISIGENAFYSCNSLISIHIPSSVISIGEGSFDYCSNLESISISEGNKNFSSHDGVLYNYEKTELLVYPRSKTGPYTIPTGITSLKNNAFYSCLKLTELVVPEGVVSIGSRAFFIAQI